jgi:hypothetical protein
MISEIVRFTIASGVRRRGLSSGICAGSFFGVTIGDRFAGDCLVFFFFGENFCYPGVKYFGKLSLKDGNT